MTSWTPVHGSFTRRYAGLGSVVGRCPHLMTRSGGSSIVQESQPACRDCGQSWAIARLRNSSRRAALSGPLYSVLVFNAAVASQ